MARRTLDEAVVLTVTEMLREGDTLVVWKLDRLGRSVKNLVDFVGELHTQGVQFKSLTDVIDTGTPSGRFFLSLTALLEPPMSAPNGATWVCVSGLRTC